MASPVAYQSPYPRFVAERMLGRNRRPFLADPALLAAANVALALERPLLLTGEPGCGKTDFAFAAATGLIDETQPIPEAARTPLEQYVRSETRARDLLYVYDAVRRFGDAQAGDEASKRRAAWPQNYVTLEALGRALISPFRRVVLIDEIDKAPRDLPNDLLRELDQGQFEIPEIPRARPDQDQAIDPEHRHLHRQMQPPPGAPKPLVIITSNVERQLPDAFLRRCVFFYIPFPDKPRLIEIVQAHFPETTAPLRASAVTVFQELRQGFRLTKAPATAELLDWVSALTTVFVPTDTERCLTQAAIQAQRSRSAVDWRALPALGCLLKLREDVERVTQGA
jgi:MoxR-like ATPase